MKKPIIGFTAAVVALAGLAFIGQSIFVSDKTQDAPFSAMSKQNNESSIAPTLNTTQAPVNVAAPPTPQLTGTDSPLLPMPESTVDAASSMANAMKNGDPRMPPVARSEPQEKATEAELADPKLYAQYEARQTMRLYKGYINAADTEIPRLQQDIAKAKAAGLKPEQIAEGEEKLRRIQQMRDQLASQHPELVQR
ncbi:MAG TPA: hypothetical protein PLN40_10955 [Agitococcus sp.]|nr:hypothetical protein [Agitococcus sp.]HNG09686.1 hypothetical protein [Agitococcus sp.]